MAIVAHARPFVIGVDTHARNHAISILACPTGEIVDEAQFPTTAAGLSRAVSWAGRRTGGDAADDHDVHGTFFPEDVKGWPGGLSGPDDAGHPGGDARPRPGRRRPW